MIQLLSLDSLRIIHKNAVEQGLAAKREVLLSGLDPAYLAMLVGGEPTDAGQLWIDLNALNQVPRIAGGLIPLRELLATAAALSAARPVLQRFYSEQAELVAQQVHTLELADPPGQAVAPVEMIPPELTIPQKVLFKSSLLPASFIAGATRTIAGVARVVLPQIENNVVRLKPSSSASTESFGTGWLIGPGHLITNWHVVEARDRRFEDAPTHADVEAQCKGARAEFDYDFEEMPPGETVTIKGLCHHNIDLDFAILALASPVKRSALPLRAMTLLIDLIEPFPVNIVQHPRAAAKQIAIRNNLVVSQKGHDLAYFTDTADGSSGSPVCDDEWRVVALHKAATQKFGTVEYHGNATVWVNIGTPIKLIIDDLKANALTLWNEIAATVG